MSASAAVSPTTIWLGLDVHKESVTIAVLRGGGAPAPDRVDRLPNDLPKLKRYLELLSGQGPLRAVYEASGAEDVLHRACTARAPRVHRACTAWGVPCDVIARPTKPGVQRKHDTYDAIQLARLHHAGELTVIRIPTEVRDLVRCRETFQRELLKSRRPCARRQQASLYLGAPASYYR